MTKWADYCISAVRYDADDKHIEKVKVHPDKGDTIGASSEETRKTVVDWIESGKSFVTIVKDKEQKWSKGEDVRVISVNGKKFIRTDSNKTESDNLGGLPTF